MTEIRGWRPLWAMVLAAFGLLVAFAVFGVGIWLASKGLPMMAGPYRLGGGFTLIYAGVTLVGSAASLWGLASFLARGGAIRFVLSLAAIAFFVVLYTAISPIF